MNWPHALKAVFFDLDGTLLDTAADLCEAMNGLLAQEGRKPVNLADFRCLIYGGAHLMVSGSFGISPDAPELATLKEQFIARYAQKLVVHTQVYPGMDTLLDYLDKHSLLWGVITNKSAALAETILAKLNLLTRSNGLIGGDTLARRKPDPDQLLYACELCKIKPHEMLYVGDVATDVIAAQRAGAMSCAVTYGYHTQESLPTEWQADLVVETPETLQRWLKERITVAKV